MFLHVGGDTIIPLRDIIAIIDASTVQRDEFRILKKRSVIEGEVINAFVVTPAGIYTSPISSTTLKRRAGFLDGLDNGSGEG